MNRTFFERAETNPSARILRVRPLPHCEHRTPSVRSALMLGVCSVFLSGCADVKLTDYKQPDAPIKQAWSQKTPVSATETVRPDWWREFRDPYLDDLVKRAVEGNIDIKVLAARTRVANAQIGEARAGALPSLDAGAGASFEKSTGQKLSKSFNLGTQVNWELDIWGKVEKGAQAQEAEFQATEADWRAGYLNLLAGVSTSYFQILQFDEQIARQRTALDKNRQILGIYESMHRNGLLPNTRVLQQRAEVNRLSRDLLDLNRSRDLAGNALSTLLGIPAGDFRVPTGELQQRISLPEVPNGLPLELLKRRPDIVAAEYRVLAAHNLIGQAKLAQLPSVSMTGRAGSSALGIGDLLKAFTFSFLPSINIPLLDPSVKARVRTSEAEIKVAEEEYKRSVINAYEEVENALVNLDSHKKQHDELQQQADNLSIVATQIEGQLREGVVSQLEVFETQRSLLEAQLALLANHQLILSDTVTLYKALGGGWPPVEVRNARQ